MPCKTYIFCICACDCITYMNCMVLCDTYIDFFKNTCFVCLTHVYVIWIVCVNI